MSRDQEVPAKTGAATARIRCLLVDDHALLRQGVRRLLEDERDFEVVDEAAHAAEAVAKVVQHRPDVVLMDIGMPGLSAFEAARLIQANCPRTRLVFLTMHEDDEYMAQSLRAGAAGYVLKDTPAGKLISVLRQIHQGGKYVSPELLGKLGRDFGPGGQGAKPQRWSAPLTPRERQVVRLLAEGRSVRQAAAFLGVSIKTVEAHKLNLMRKLDIHNKVQLVTYAIQQKIVDLAVSRWS